MKPIRSLLRMVGLANTTAKTVVRFVRARYEAASPARRGLWPGQENMSPDAAARPSIRKVLRERCRTQVENDPIAAGIVDTLAFDLVGCGPRLKLIVDPVDADSAEIIEKAFELWGMAVGLPEKLRTIRRSRAVDGEAVGILTNNPEIENLVKLDLKLVECEQLTSLTPMATGLDFTLDGITLDEFGNPKTYSILRRHPGSLTGSIQDPWVFDVLPAKDVIHYFRATRPGQHRGLPDIAPALLRFAYLQRFTLATIQAAETAASFAGVLKSDIAPEGADPVEALEQIEVDKGMFTTMPLGWDMNQFKAEHPSTTFREFRSDIIGDIARCLQMPLNTALLNSSSFNFASGRLDWLVYSNSLRVDRDHLGRAVLDRILRAFLDEAILISGLIPPKARRLIASGSLPPHMWMWPGGDHPIDPETEAMAANERLVSYTSTLQDEWAKKGMDFRDALKQIAAERALMDQLGIPPITRASGGQAPTTPDEGSQPQDKSKGSGYAG